MGKLIISEENIVLFQSFPAQNICNIKISVYICKGKLRISK